VGCALVMAVLVYQISKTKTEILRGFKTEGNEIKTQKITVMVF